jgi:pilus assembly protein CpaB
VQGEELNRRVIGLLLAVLLAGVATYFLIQYVTSADERAREDEAFVEVFVAQADIPAGTSADDASAQGLIGRDEIPARSVPEGAVGDLESISGQVAAGPIFTGEVIVAQRFGETGAQPTGVLEVPEDLQAVTVEAGIAPGLAGFVQAGDTVSVLATIDVPQEPAPAAPEDEELPAPEEGQAGGVATSYIAQNVEVLVVGQRIVVTEEGQEVGSVQQSNDLFLFTLAMTPEDIERLVFASQQGSLWFTLLPQMEDEDAEREVVDTPGRTFQNIFE